MVKLKYASLGLGLLKLFSTILAEQDDCECVSVNELVSDQWCVDDCMCPWCDGCGQGICAGYCACAGPTEPPTTPDPNAPTTVKTTTDPSQKCAMPWKYNVIYIDYSINWNDLYTDIEACVNACFNVINISFWVSGRMADAAQVWSQTMTPEMRQRALDLAHANGVKILLAGGGATDNIEGKVANGEGDWYGRQLATDAVKYMFDGVDFDTELNPGHFEPFTDGSFRKFTFDAAKAAREVMGPDALILSAPQSPYFGVWTHDSALGFTEWLQDPENELDAASIQFYNQCPTCYYTFESLFVDGDYSADPKEGHSITGESALGQMIANGAPPEKLIVGKPIYSSGFASNGYVDPKDLHDWGCRARLDNEKDLTFYNGTAVPSPYWQNWSAGFMTWMYRRGENYHNVWGNAIASPCAENPDFPDDPDDPVEPVEGCEDLEFSYNALFYEDDQSFNMTTAENAVRSCYNVLVLGYSNQENSAASQFINMESEDKQTILDYLNKYNVKLIVSAGGPEKPFKDDYNNGNQWGNQLADLVFLNGFHGLDVNIHDGSQKDWNSEEIQNFLLDLGNGARNKLAILDPVNEYHLSITGKARYFGSWAGKSHGLASIFEKNSETENLYNVAFINYYNECNNCYNTYKRLFVQADHGITNDNTLEHVEASSISEILEANVRPEKLVIVKPLSHEEIYANNGFVDQVVLSEWGCDAKRDKFLTQYWSAGFMSYFYYDVDRVEYAGQKLSLPCN